MSRARKIWKWVALVTGGLVVVLALGVGALRIWLEHSPDLAPEIVARVERLTGIRFAFKSIDARLSLRGPELVFREARLTVPGQQHALVTARAGRVGFDLWRSLRTGRLAAGRIVLEGARVWVYVTDEGVELRGRGDLGADAAGERLSARDLPVGRVRIEDSTVTVKDLRSDALPWRVDAVTLDVEHDPDLLDLKGQVRLPDAFGASLALAATFEGDLDAPATVAWHASVNLKRASVAGWTRLVPQWRWLPTDGHGDLSASVSGRGPLLSSANARFDLERVTLPPLAGTPAPVFRELAGRFEVQQANGRWRATGHDIVVDTGHEAWRRGEFTFGLDLDAGGIRRLALSTPLVHLDALAALGTLLPQGRLREDWALLAPRGTLSRVDVTAVRGTGPAEWRIDGGLRYAGLGFGAVGALPGIGGIDGEIRAKGASGTITLASHALSFDMPRIMRTSLAADRVQATFGWWWQPDGWRFGVDDLLVHTPDGAGGGKAHLWLPSNGDSPQLQLDLMVTSLEARAATRYLPGRVIPARAMEWLDQAFLAGRVHDVHIEFVGPTRLFPFRDGGGLFRISGPYEGLRIHYFDGFADLEEATGFVEFKNAGFSATAGHVRVGGLDVTNGEARMPEFKDAELFASAHATGDVGRALTYLQESPLGPVLGSYFQKLSGHGPVVADVTLDLPFKRFAERHIGVAARVEHASGRLPGIADELHGVTGSFTLRDHAIDVPAVTASVFGGTVTAKAHTVPVRGAPAGSVALVVEAQGRSNAEQLQPALGITMGRWLTGVLDWHADFRLPHDEWRPAPVRPPPGSPPDAEPVPHELETRWLPSTLHLESTLAGLGLGFPAPLAKPAEEARPLRVELDLDPGVADDAPPLPAAFHYHDAPHEASMNVRVQLGHDNAVFAFAGDDLRFHGGTLRFAGESPALREAPGLWLEGRIPSFDLSAWLEVHLGGHSDKGITDVLRGASVRVGDFAVLGFHFPALSVALSTVGETWHAQVDSADARGTVIVPWDFRHDTPLVLDLEHLAIGDYVPAGGAAGAPVSPLDLPAVNADVRDLEILKRRFGAFSGHVVRAADGLRLESATVKGASYRATGSGSWTDRHGEQATSVAFELDSTDLLDTLNAWGFEPTITSKAAHASADLHWDGGIDEKVLGRLGGTVKLKVSEGQLLSVAPGAGRVLGLLSLGALPRRLTLDFSDLTDKGFAFDSVHGDFEFRDGNAYTNDLVLKGPAAEIGIVGRTGLTTRDYDQTAKVTGHVSTPLAAASALVGGPAVGAAVFLFSSVFKESLGGIARGYYHITGSWEQPKVERIGADAAREANAASAPQQP